VNVKMSARERIKKLFLKQFPFFISVPALLWQFFFLYFPLLFILYVSFISKDGVGAFTGKLTISHYLSVLNWQYCAIVMRSFGLAVGNSIISLLLAYPVAYFLAFRVKKWKNLFLFLIILPFWTNLLVQVYAWFFVLEPYGIVNLILMKSGIIAQPLYLLNSVLAVFLGMVYCYVPFMVVPLYSTLESIDGRLLEASADLGASPLETFQRITLPLSVPGIRTGFFLVFIPSFGEFVIPALLGGGKSMYVGTLISHHFLILQNTFTGAALTTVSGVLLLCFSLCTYYCLMYTITFFARGHQSE